MKSAITLEESGGKLTPVSEQNLKHLFNMLLYKVRVLGAQASKN